MKKRNPLAVVFLSIITFGIYDLYWLVKTKAVLNQRTKSHTPTIWLLILPYLILVAGYVILITSSLLTNVSTGTSPTATGEQLNAKGSRRPPQYLHICNTADKIQYVSQGNPKCLGNDAYQSDYDPSVAGTVYSSPCKTTGGTLRYVYIATDESCPTGTTLIFYNTISGSLGSTTTNSSNGGATTTASDTNNQIAHPALAISGFGLIAVGFMTTFAVSAFWFFRFSKAIDEYTSGKMSTAVTFLILWLIHLIGVALIQDTFNDMDDSGPLPGQPVPAAAALTPVPPTPDAPAPTAPEPFTPAPAVPSPDLTQSDNQPQATPPPAAPQPPVAPPVVAPSPEPPSQAPEPVRPDTQNDVDNNDSSPV